MSKYMDISISKKAKIKRIFTWNKKEIYSSFPWWKEYIDKGEKIFFKIHGGYYAIDNDFVILYENL